MNFQEAFDYILPILEDHSPFPLPDQDREALKGLLVLKELESGDDLVSPAFGNGSIAIVLSGVLGLSFIDEEGDEYCVMLKKPGDLAGTHIPLFKKSYEELRLNVRAITRTQVVMINSNALDFLSRTFVSWHYWERDFYLEFYLQMEKRLRNLLTLNSSQRYRRFVKEHSDIRSELPLHVIASYLGITPVSLSRIRSKL